MQAPEPRSSALLSCWVILWCYFGRFQLSSLPMTELGCSSGKKLFQRRLLTGSMAKAAPGLTLFPLLLSQSSKHYLSSLGTIEHSKILQTICFVLEKHQSEKLQCIPHFRCFELKHKCKIRCICSMDAASLLEVCWIAVA